MKLPYKKIVNILLIAYGAVVFGATFTAGAIALAQGKPDPVHFGVVMILWLGLFVVLQYLIKNANFENGNDSR